MAYIPIESKISLINKYIQVNILRNNGEAMHVDHLENEIFTKIIEDLKSFNEKPEEEEEVSLRPTIDALRSYQLTQRKLKEKLDDLLEGLKQIEETEEDQLNLGTIIKSLEELDRK
ncbi:MAG: hypothetical protein ABFS32_09645 [Bacteroidota bacterium]